MALSVGVSTLPALAVQYSDVNSLVITPYPSDAAWDLGLRPLNNPEERTEAYQALENYNFNLGGLYLNLGAGMRTTFNDNIGLSQNDRESDFILSPRINLGGLYQLTEINALSFNVGVAYNYYLENNDRFDNNLIITPDSAMDFTVYAGDYVRIVLYDQFTMLQDAVDDPTIDNTFEFGRLMNTAGLSSYWDINENTQFTFGYRHTLMRSLNSQFDFIDRQTHSIHGQLTHQLNDRINTGIFTSVGLTEYDESFNNNSVITTVGAFIESPLSEYLTGRVEGSYMFGEFESGSAPGANGDADDLSSFAFEGSLSHRLNEVVSHTLSGGRMARLGTTTNFYELWYARHHANIKLVDKTSLHTQAFMEFGDESGGILSEEFFRWGAGVTLSYQLTEALRTQLNYLFIDKDSDRALGDYYQNRVTLDLNYRF
jgi:hypothetical protein